MKNRKGRIQVSNLMLNDIDNVYKAFNTVFAEFIPIFIDRDFNGSYYSGYCIHFDEIDIGEVLPEYEAVITDTEGTYSVKYIRK